MLTGAGEELQALVDAAAAELARPIGIDDRRFRPVAYSAHRGGFDRVRAECILERASPAPAVRWIESLGVPAATGIRRVPASPALGMAPRVCVPLRYGEHTVGFLWLIDEPDPLSAGELATARAVAERAAVLLHRIRLLERQRRHREQLLLERLAVGAGATPARAARELTEAGYLETAERYRVLVLRIDGDDRAGAVRAAIADALDRLRRTMPPSRMVAGEVAGKGIAVLACAPGEDAHRRAEAVAELAGASGAPGGRPAVGVSGAVPADRLDAACRQAFDAASLAVDGVRPGAVQDWDELGAYATILEARSRPDPLAAVPDGVLRLLESRDGPALLETLECYLERGGDAVAAAREIGVHRSSLYARLRRIEAITGNDLRSGDDRLTLHLGLRLWRLAGAPAAGRLPAARQPSRLRGLRPAG